jgi:hypothetical protein
MSKKRKLRNYLLNARFQLPFTAAVVLLAAGLTAGLGSIWYGQAREASRVIETSKLSAPQSKAECCDLCELPGATITDLQIEEIRRDLAAKDRARLWWLIAFGLAFSMLLTFYGILMTHKVAGPLYKIALHMKDIKDGRLYPLWGLRKGDRLQDFWLTFRDMHQTLRDRTSRDVEVLARAIGAGEEAVRTADSANMREALEEMRALRHAKVELLGPSEEPK